MMSSEPPLQTWEQPPVGSLMASTSEPPHGRGEQGPIFRRALVDMEPPPQRGEQIPRPVHTTRFYEPPPPAWGAVGPGQDRAALVGATPTGVGNSPR